jgi:replicative DNA helicase
VASEGLSGSLQDNVLTLACFSEASSKIVRGTVDVSLFTTRVYRDIISVVYAYIDRYGKPPGAHIADELEASLSKGDDDAKLMSEVLLQAQQLWTNGFNERYALDQLERFVRQQSMKVGIVKAHEYILRGDLDAAESTIVQSLRRRDAAFSPGITLVDAVRLLSRDEGQRDVLSLGIRHLDMLRLGPARQELHLFLAPAKRGKSWWLVHCAKRAIAQRWKGVYITLELSDKFVGRRLLQSLFSAKTRDDAQVSYTTLDKDAAGNVTGFSSKTRDRPSIAKAEELQKLLPKIRDARLNDRLLIKQFPTGTLTVRALDAYLDQLETQHGFVPDFVMLDYPDLMKVDTRDYRIALGTLFKDLRGLAVARNLALIAASQVNRAGANSKVIRETDVAEDYSKIATADCAITYNQTEEERARGLARLYVAAGRVEVDRFSVVVTQNYTTGQFSLDSWYLKDEYWGLLKDGEDE